MHFSLQQNVSFRFTFLHLYEIFCKVKPLLFHISSQNSWINISVFPFFFSFGCFFSGAHSNSKHFGTGRFFQIFSQKTRKTICF